GRDVRHRRMEAPREHEADARLVEAALHAGRIELDVDPELLEQVGGATMAGGGAVAVLGYRDAGARDDERRHRRDVERAGAVAPGAARVDHEIGRASCRERVWNSGGGTTV